MGISDIHKILNEAKQVETIKWIYFEGGEPFLYYQTMLWGLRKAKRYGFKTAIVTNAYWATSIEDAKEWLNPMQEIGLSNLSISDDVYHYDKTEENLAKYAYEAAKDLRISVDKIAIEDPMQNIQEIEWKGKPVIKGKVLFKGRAVEKLVEGIPTEPWTKFTKCSDEDFSNQSRVHIDPFGFIHVCQGITIGNMREAAMSEILADFDPEKHPICSSILRGGPAGLARDYNVEHEQSYVDECHLCYSTRLKLRRQFPNILAPDQIYGA